MCQMLTPLGDKKRTRPENAEKTWEKDGRKGEEGRKWVGSCWVSCRCLVRRCCPLEPVPALTAQCRPARRPHSKCECVHILSRGGVVGEQGEQRDKVEEQNKCDKQ